MSAQTRVDNSEYFAGRSAFGEGKSLNDNPFSYDPKNIDSRYFRWLRGYVEREKETAERATA